MHDGYNLLHTVQDNENRLPLFDYHWPFRKQADIGS